MPDGLLKTKLFPPPPRPNHVTRKPLLDRLTQARQKGIPCALVSAPAGFGKTTLVADCTRAIQQPFAWLALDEGDNDLLRFWRYVDAAFESVDSRIGEGLRPALHAAQAIDIQHVITGIVNDIASLERKFILVLDDYHVIELPAIHDSLNYLLDHLPPQLCVVIITRSDPPLNLARRRVRGDLTEIRAADLRFTLDETTAFLNQSMQLSLTDADIASLSQRTEGWIAGLQMAALSLQDETEPHQFVAAFSGGDHYVADYLVEEVLQRQLAEVQRFLLQTSILDRMNASLCDAVTGRQDSRVMLNTLERANLFILPLDNRREWFRYHHLFADLLQQRLAENTSPEALANLHQAAATWHETQGDIASAVQHTRALPDDHAILHLLERSASQFFVTAQLPQFCDFANHIPPDVRKESPFLCMALGWAGTASNRHAEAAGWLNDVEANFGLSAEAALNDPSLDTTRRSALLEVLVVRLQFPYNRSLSDQRAHILAILDQFNALPPDQFCLFNNVVNLRPVVVFNLAMNFEAAGELELASRTFAQATELCLNLKIKNAPLYYLNTSHLANIQILQGHLHAARHTYQKALGNTADFGQPTNPYVSLAHAGLGALEFEWNNITAARQHFSDGILLARLWSQWESLIPLTLGQAWIKQRAGHIQAAVDILNDLETPSIPGTDIPLRAYAALLGGSDSASGWLASHPAESTADPNPTNEFLLLTVAHMLALTHQKDHAIVVLRKLIEFAQNNGLIHVVVQSKTALSVIANQVDTLLEALSLAEPEGYISTFVMEGEPMADLLQHALKRPQLEPRLAAYARRILSAFDNARKPNPPGALVEPLSEREVEVLRHIANGLSNSEIAQRLYLSPNTLKAHTQNIFLKLEVHSRLQAVNKARELGLIE
ncbi:MAG: LuxR C-terminal-related transcriptional regulator [Chloroflexota bacterium]